MKTSFFKSFITLSGSNLVAQLINLLTYIILPKYFFSPKEFGVFGTFLPIYFVLYEVVNLKMDQSIILPKEDADAKKLVNFSCLTALIFAILVTIFFLIIYFIFPSVDKHLVYFMGVSLLLGGCLQPILVWLNRNSAYFKMGNIRVLQALATLVISILSFYLLDDLFNGLIIGFIGGQLVALLMALFFIPKENVGLPDKALLNKYNQFIKFGTLSAMIGTLSRNIPAFAIKLFFGNEWLGYYTLAVKYLNAPIGIFSTSIGQIYFKESSVADGERLKTLTSSIIKNVFALSIIPTVLLLFFGGGIFKLVFGAEWFMAGKIVQVFILWYLIAYISGPLSVLLDVKMELEWELNYSAILLVFRFLALATALIFQNILIVLSIYAFVGIVFNLILLNFIVKLSKEDV